MGDITVLVVEDDALVRMSTVELLQEEGFTVIAAERVSSALLNLHAHEPVHCLVTDVHLGGGMTGLDLAEAVREQWPKIKIVVVSGRIHGDEVQNVSFLPKPFTGVELASRIRHLLGDSGSDRTTARRHGMPADLDLTTKDRFR